MQRFAKSFGIRLIPAPSSLLLQALLVALTLSFALPKMGAQTITSIYDFGSHANDPLNPQNVGVIAQGRDGNMWSTAPKGGANGIGAAFKVTPAGVLTVVHSFDPTTTPPEGTSFSGLTLGNDGNFYGTMSNGGASGNGAVFRMTPTGTVKILYSFTGGNDGKAPEVPPIQAINGNFWGTTSQGGIDGVGTVYEITAAGALTTIFQFDETDGTFPVGPLVQGTDGNFYGTTKQGNTNCGNDDICPTVYKLTPTGTFTQLTSFPFNAFVLSQTVAGLVEGNDGNYYGTLNSGTKTDNGELFKITPKGVVTDLYDFTGGSDGANPEAGLLLATDGNFYGVTPNAGNGFGTFFQFNTKTLKLSPTPFSGTDGSLPSVTPFQNTNGTIYGTASEGGKVTNTGTFYKVTGYAFEKQPFISLVPNFGKVGTTIGILGQGLTGTSAVSFNGSSATFKIVSSTFMTAVVPPGATTGQVTVTTSTSTLKSNKKFFVLK